MSDIITTRTGGRGTAVGSEAEGTRTPNGGESTGGRTGTAAEGQRRSKTASVGKPGEPDRKNRETQKPGIGVIRPGILAIRDRREGERGQEDEWPDGRPRERSLNKAEGASHQQGKEEEEEGQEEGMKPGVGLTKKYLEGREDREEEG